MLPSTALSLVFHSSCPFSVWTHYCTEHSRLPVVCDFSLSVKDKWTCACSGACVPEGSEALRSVLVQNRPKSPASLSSPLRSATRLEGGPFEVTPGAWAGFGLKKVGSKEF